MRTGAKGQLRQRGPGPAVLVCLALGGFGGLLTLLADLPQATPSFVFPAFLLVPLYVAGIRLSVDFELRRHSHSVLLTQIPLALGALLVPPILHLAYRLLASLAYSLWHRQHPLKALYNAGSGALEVGIVTFAVSAVAAGGHPGPVMWLALYVGILLAEVLSGASLTVVWWLIGIPVSAQDLRQRLGVAVLTSTVFTGLAIVALLALWTEPASAALVAALAGGLALAYRGHRKLSAQQRSTEQLYEFVKDLGPLSDSLGSVPATLEHVRDLLQARHLDLAIVEPSGGWRHVVVTEDDASPLPTASPDELAVLADLAEEVRTTGAPALRTRQVGDPDRMATPLVGTVGLLGVLTATERLGAVRPFDMGDLRLLETVATELTTALERGRLLEDLGRAATTDALTGLPNLTETARLIEQQLQSGGVLLAAVAVESFREVNDTLGHQVGDALLLEVSRRLLLANPGAVIGRMGGGRFAVAVPARGTDTAGMFGLNLRAQVEGAAQVGPAGTHVRLSVGVVTGPEHGGDGATLLRRAETAMHSAREVHGGPVLWEPAYEIKGQRRLAVVTALREALAGGAIGLSFQPKLDAVSGRTTGVEALARWTHPALGPVSPDEFIPLAEASGLMGPLTNSVLRQALVACRGWQRRAPQVGVAVNVSADTVLDASFVTEVATLLTSVGVEPALLTLELTESIVVGDPLLAAERMRELSALGVKISVDDFGTGYSSLTYLKGLPVDEVKIDRGFVDKLTEDPADRAVVRAVVDIAHTLGLTVVAEGVEFVEQHDLLRALGVDEVQGYLHARPMAALDTAQWLRRREQLTRG